MPLALVACLALAAAGARVPAASRSAQGQAPEAEPPVAAGVPLAAEIRWVRGSRPAAAGPMLIVTTTPEPKAAAEAAERAAVLYERVAPRGVGVVLLVLPIEQPGTASAPIAAAAAAAAAERLASLVRWSSVPIGVAPAARIPPPECMALDHAGDRCWQGDLSVDVERIAEELAQGTFDARYWREHEAGAAAFATALRENAVPPLHAFARRLLSASRSRAEPWCLELLAAVLGDRDEEAAFLLANRAGAALAGRPEELHRFAMFALALASLPARRGAAGAGEQEEPEGDEPPAEDASPALPRVRAHLPQVALQALNVAVRRPHTPLRLRVDHVAALRACERHAQARAAAVAIERALTGGGEGSPAADELLRLRRVLGESPLLPASASMRQFEGNGPALLDALGLLLNRLNRQFDDPDTATMVGRWLVAGYDDDPHTLNNLAWYLATEPDTKGRFVRLGARAGETMRRCGGWEAMHTLDTLALVLFEYGLTDVACTLQTRAIAAGGGVAGIDRDYATRQALYEAARAARLQRSSPATAPPPAPAAAGEPPRRGG